ncbi:TerD family protein [Mesorhizobium carmichaelinearum]|uniref:TerD family protein n=1 Tax=Mesorhizobium carmichaelinearum TaxID=1208188 RepID=UPI000BA48115|nr:TerD family protein [Mesorhizobium carmichaelinearum]
MSISLSKGGNISLSKEVPSLSKISVGLGWDPKVTDGRDFDLDASAFILNTSGRTLSDKHFVFYNNLKSPDGAVVHTGDNTTGQGDGDDEVLTVDLKALSPEAARIAFTVTIHDAQSRGQNFGQVGGSFIRVLDGTSGREIARYDLNEDYSTQTAMIFGEVYLNNGEWKFRAVGEGYAGGLGAMAKQYGLNAS